MKNFKFVNPTQIIFGQNSIAQLPKVLPQNSKPLLVFGGGSVRKNGVYDQVVAALQGYEYSEFWGIESNPTVETIRTVIEQARRDKNDWVLAIGGGSVIDACKLISAGILVDKDPWDIVLSGVAKGPFVPLGCILTLPATASEMNAGSVISSQATQEKFPFHGQFPKFSILDPEVTYTLPKYQLACGLADSFVHVIEQYLTWPNQSLLMDRWAEGLLLTIKEIAPKVLDTDNIDYDSRAEFMMCATNALNGFIRRGVVEDWSTHMIGHELTALTGIAHAHSLVIVLPGTLRIMGTLGKREKMLQYAERVWNITEGDEESRIEKAIVCTEEFFRSLGFTTRLSEAGIGEDIERTLVQRFEERGTILGERQDMNFEVVEKILASCRR